MAVFLSNNHTYPYSVVSFQGSFLNPLSFTYTKNIEDKSDIKEIRVYIVITGENVSYLKIYADNQIIPGITLTFAKDYQGIPGKYSNYLEFQNLNAINEGRDLVIPIWIKINVDDNISHGLYQNNLVVIEYE